MGDLSIILPGEGGIPTSVPRVSTLPAYAPAAQLAETAATGANSLADTAFGQVRMRGMTSAITASSGAAMDMHAEMNKILTEPLPKRFDAKAYTFERATDDETGAPYAVTALATMSRSQYIADQAPARLAKVRDAYLSAADAPTRRILQTHPYLSLDRAYARVMEALGAHQRDAYENEQVAGGITLADRMERHLLTSPVPPTRSDDGMQVRISVATDDDYTSAKTAINQYADAMLSGGIRAATAEKYRTDQLGRLAQSRALQYATQRPDDWTASRVFGTNEWDREVKDVQRLTTLDARAQATTAHISAESARLTKQRREDTNSQLEDEYLSGVPGAAVMEHVRQALRDRVIHREDAHYFQVITERPVEKVISDPAIFAQLGGESADPRVGRDFITRVRAFAEAGKLSAKDSVELQRYAGARMEARENRLNNQQVASANRAYAQVHDILRVGLKTDGLLDKLDQTGQASRMDAFTELGRYDMQHRDGSGDYYGWLEQNKPRFLAQRDSIYQGNMDLRRQQLGALGVSAFFLPQDKQGLIEDAAFDGARKTLATQYGVTDPATATAAQFPRFFEGLRILKEMDALNAERRSLLIGATRPLTGARQGTGQPAPPVPIAPVAPTGPTQAPPWTR